MSQGHMVRKSRTRAGYWWIVGWLLLKNCNETGWENLRKHMNTIEKHGKNNEHT
jgi:hypothetical protein